MAGGAGTAHRGRQTTAALDRFAGTAVLDPLARYSALWSEDRAARTELAELRAEAQSRAREIDLLTFGLEEIERIGPGAGEDAAQRQRLRGCSPLTTCRNRPVGRTCSCRPR